MGQQRRNKQKRREERRERAQAGLPPPSREERRRRRHRQPDTETPTAIPVIDTKMFFNAIWNAETNLLPAARDEPREMETLGMRVGGVETLLDWRRFVTRLGATVQIKIQDGSAQILVLRIPRATELLTLVNGLRTGVMAEGGKVLRELNDVSETSTAETAEALAAKCASRIREITNVDERFRVMRAIRRQYTLAFLPNGLLLPPTRNRKI